MPTYVYGPKDHEPRECAVCAAHFEVTQTMKDEPLTHCPKCGGEIERVIQPVNFGNIGRIRKPGDDRLARAGFTQYKRQGKGHYEKTFGGGPEALHPGSD